jgi:hypothetical protein
MPTPPYRSGGDLGDRALDQRTIERISLGNPAARQQRLDEGEVLTPQR